MDTKCVQKGWLSPIGVHPTITPAPAQPWPCWPGAGGLCSASGAHAEEELHAGWDSADVGGAACDAACGAADAADAYEAAKGAGIPGFICYL